MGIFQQNILKPEELIGNFEPLGFGDETFALNTMGNYPGDVPDFDFFESLLPARPEVTLEPELNSELDATTQDSDGVWEMFADDDQSDTNESVSTDDIDNLFTNSDQNFASEFQDEPNSEYQRPEFSDFEDSNPEQFADDDKLEQMLKNAMNDEEIETKSANTLDGELSAVNIDELFSEQVIAPIPAITPQAEPEIIAPTPKIQPVNDSPNKEFQDIENIAGAVEINIDNLYPTYPSTTGINEKEPEATQESVPDKDKKIKKEKIKKPLNKKLLKRVAYSAAAFVLLAATGLGVYYSGLIGTVNNWVASLSHSDTTAAVHKEVKPKQEVRKEQPTVAEVEKIEANHSENVEPQATETQHSEPIAKEAHKEVKLEPIEKVKEHKTKELPKAIAKVNNHQENVKKVAKAHVEPTTPKVKAKTDVAAKTPVKKTDKKVINAPESKPETEVYVIQIYASPSKEDAQEWLRKVQKRIGAEAYISTQVVRDKVWYRVRCGHYTSKESANAAAEKYGFSQSWVDRIK